MKIVELALIALAAAGGATAAPVSRADAARSPDLPAFVRSLDSLRTAAKIAGLSVAVVKDGAIVLALGLGEADVEHHVPATAETPYNIASVTKPLSAVVALRLVEQGALDLDRPLAEYTEWAGFCDEFAQQPSIFAKDLRCVPRVHTLRHLLSHTATGTPGTRFSYNPLLYSWASRPIRAAADTTFSALVERIVFAPAGMTRSARMNRDLPLRADLAKALALPYRVGASGALERAPMPPPQGDGAAGGVVTTALDLAKFDLALDRGALISAASRAAMMSPMRTPDGKPLPYGLGWFVEEHDGRTLVWHCGRWDGAYTALYLKVPARNVTFIALANGEGVWSESPLDRADVEQSAFARAFLRAFAGD